MKKKIMVFMLLFAFLVGMFGAVPVKAEDDVYTFEEWCANNGLVCGKASDEDWSSADKHFNYDPSCLYFVIDGSPMYCCEISITNMSDLSFYFGTSTQYGSDLFYYANVSGYVPLKAYKYSSDGWHFNNSGEPYIEQGGSGKVWSYCSSSIVYSLVDIYSDNNFTEVAFAKTPAPLDLYTFEEWCSDAGLNCAASSSETEDLYNFSFNSEENHYLIRRNRISGSEYTWYLSQVTKDDDLIYYATNRALADSSIGAYNFALDDGTADYSASSVKVSNFVYDSSGEGWLFVDCTSTDLGFTNPFYMDDIGISFSSSMPIVYSDVDIYSDKEQSSVYYAASTEYEDSEVTYPDISPTSTPTPTPISNSGSTDLGGNVIAGGGIDFIISLVSSLWNRVYSIPMNVDGFQISLQQLYVYGILAGIVGAAIFAFTRRK